MLTFKWGHAFAIMKSWLWILTHMEVLKERRRLFNDKKSLTPDLIYQKSIVKQYFIKRKKIYNSIVFFNKNI